jgi:hypothetical protein
VTGAERWRSVAPASAAVERRQASALRFRARAASDDAAVEYASVGVSPPFFLLVIASEAEEKGLLHRSAPRNDADIVGCLTTRA